MVCRAADDGHFGLNAALLFLYATMAEISGVLTGSLEPRTLDAFRDSISTARRICAGAFVGQ